MAGKWRGLRGALLRKTHYRPEDVEATRLRRCLTRWQLTAVGVGSTLGVGVYVIVGNVALGLAGPSVVLSFLIAAVAALFAGLCYAEFGCRIPRAGAAYSYTHLACGEAAAFLVGWNNILEAVFGAASLARGLCLHTDTMFNMTMSAWFTSVAPISVDFISPYFDLFACCIVLSMGALVAAGVREAALVNSMLSAANVVFVLFIIVVGSFAADSNNWFIPLEDVPASHGVGGFFPYGIWGTLKGAAVCFYAFVAFDTICAAGEEVLEPRRVLPITILSVLGITFICYVGVSIVISMMVPYYLKNNVIAVSEAFSYVGWDWAKWIVCLGSLCGLYASLFGALYPLTRLLYSMSCDGLLAGWLSKVTGSRQSPVVVTIGSTVVVALLAALMELEPLMLMLCIGTLLSYTAVAVGVIVLRYGSDYTPGQPRYLRQMFGCGRSPTRASSRIVTVSLFLFMCLSLASALVVTNVQSPLIPSAVLNALVLMVLLVMTVQPQVKEIIHFRTPLVPLVPCLSIYINLHLMVLINIQNWIRIGIWTLIGIIIYLITICCCKHEQKSKLEDNIAISLSNSHTNRNGKPPVQIIVESPTPPDTLNRISYYGGEEEKEDVIQEVQESIVRTEVPVKKEEIVLHQAYIENNEEKEAKIIDLLDQVLQAEEDSYAENTSIKEQKEENENFTENAVQRKSLSELSDAGSDASLVNPGLSKYDVVAQVHREDLPRVDEDEEKSERDDIYDNEIDDHEQITAFNDCDSRTDESGYSDTIDRNALSECLEESKEEIQNIPVPPPLPLDENFFKSPNFKKSYTIASPHRSAAPSPEECKMAFLDIPAPPPLPLYENFYRNPNFKKSYSIGSSHRNFSPSPEYQDEENKPRESIKSNTSNASLGDGNLAFGSDRQIDFMCKLNNIFQNKMTNSDDEEPRQRSHSTGNVVENPELTLNRERSPMFLALKNEIISKQATHNLKPVDAEEIYTPVKTEDQTEEQAPQEADNISLSKEDLKTKLENIYAAGGPKLLKPRLKKPNHSPEESYQTDTSSTESIPKLPKIEKNDTLKRQKDKFSEVLNSFKLSFNKDDVV